MVSGSTEYVIYHPEKLRLVDIFSVLVLRRRLSSSQFIESNTQDAKLEVVLPSIIGLITLILQKILSLFSIPLRLLGYAVEFVLNLFSLNGGFFGLFFHIITGSLRIPKRDSEDYRSIIGHIDGRKELHKFSSLLCHLPSIGPIDTADNTIGMFDLCAMSATIAYENQAYVRNVVTKYWKMHFVGFYNFWNEFLKASDTQAFIFCDSPKDAKMIFVAFRGTEPFSANDWSTDIDLSFLPMGNMGRAHLGFMKALGLQDDKDYRKGWPKNYTGDKDLAYYTIREKLKDLLEQNKGARIVITGHSLGGALAAVFPSVLILHEETAILNRLAGVYTFGQPRVGDRDFGDMITTELNVTYQRYFRVVYRFDLVPRVPFDDPVSQFAHFGGCLYYKSWYKGEVLKIQPNDNYFSLRYIIPKYFNAWVDLFRGIFAWIKPGREFKEGPVSIMFRLVGLLIPGIASHSPRDYINGARLAKVVTKEEGEVIYV